LYDISSLSVGVLLALLLVADWYRQNPSPLPRYGRPITRRLFGSDQHTNGPQKVELDTTTPIIVSRSTPSPDAAEIPIPPTSKPALNALAQANLLHKQVAKRTPPARAKYRSPNSDGEFRFAVNPMPSAWPVGW
jgi:hypothetical protein